MSGALSVYETQPPAPWLGQGQGQEATSVPPSPEYFGCRAEQAGQAQAWFLTVLASRELGQ